MRRSAVILSSLLLAAPCSAAGRTPRVHALVHARVVPAPGTVLDDATIVLRDGVVEAVGSHLAPPPDARVWDLRGRTVYAGFVEAWLDRTPAPAPRGGSREGPAAPVSAAPPAARGAGADNVMVRAEVDVASTLDLGRDALDELRALGFTAAHVVPGAGVFRGQSALVNLRDGSAADQLLRPHVAQVMAFELDRGGPAGSGRPGGYPSSIMGSVALARQSLLDAGWARDAARLYATSRGVTRPHDDVSLRALSAVLPAYGKQPLWMVTGDVLGCLRADAVAREFGCDAVLLGNGDEYRYLDALRAAGRPFVLQVNYPEPPRAADDDEALDVDLEALRHWDTAADNPHRMQAAGIPFALSSQGLRKRTVFLARVRLAIERGLAPDAALAALTTVPAHLLGADTQLGRIEQGRIANLTVADGDLFAGTARVVEVWVEGDRYEIANRGDLEALKGDWKLSFQRAAAKIEPTLHVEGSEWTLTARIQDAAGIRALTEVRWAQSELTARSGDDRLRFAPPAAGSPDAAAGMWWFADGSSAPVRGTKVNADAKPAAAADSAKASPPAAAASAAVASVPWPPKPGPRPRAVVVRGATVWTCGPQGILADADLVAVDGKITAVGRGLRAPGGAVEVDGRGMHLTPGLVDCHSHSDLVGSVNEGTNICTAEVRTADILDSESIALYRELAGGLTVANQLHGSANSIGGQNTVIKLRWSEPPAGLVFRAAPPGIKFALGENPKQSNWDDRNDRFPQTRMGVEQSIRERFIAARDYARQWNEYRHKGKNAIPPRRDLQLEAIAEILSGERLVHCHSYRADEILMMMRVAEEFGFRVATFQHVLEGYKVADEMALHGAGASSFSDWWAYKFEVYDAIPYNGSILHDRGVVVSFNSDSSELARHLYLEAAKAVKYGGVPEPDALAFATLNPAKQLRIDNRVGSLEPGKDADFALWTQSPLAATTRCEQTWIEGRKYFDRRLDLAARGGMEAERGALVAKAREARKKMKPEESATWGVWRPSYGAEHGASCHEEVQP